VFAPPDALLPSLAAVIGIGVPLFAAKARGRTYAMFALVLVTLSFPAGVVLALRLIDLSGPRFGPLVGWLFVYGIAATGLHMASLVRARLRQRWVRYAMSVPGMTMLALGALALPFLVLLAPVRGLLGLAHAHGALAALAYADWLPVVAIAHALATSFGARREFVRIDLAQGGEPQTLQRVAAERSFAPLAPTSRRPLRFVQITDPHIGPWQPVHRLERRIAELIAHAPDLVLLTGDFLTMESNGSRGALAQALSPLAPLRGRCFAIFGNHDHEAPEEVQSALAANGIRLLIDAEAVVETPAGPVQIVGADHYWEEREERVPALLKRFPRRPGHLRLFLLHDPLGFRSVPKGEVDLTLSGHTHGGQLGLVSFGLDWTVLSRSRWPDHGLFGLGASRLYVHRGTGFYGFPLRVGVPGELSLVELLPRES
jgi:predicted MPP superfamily phosphohydrolase